MKIVLQSCIGATIILAATSAASAQQSTETYTYDALGRLVKVQTTGGANGGVAQDYTYDDAGNRTNVRVAGASSSSGDGSGDQSGDNGSSSNTATGRRPYFNGLFTIFVSQ
ncbi:hypothetical protein [uncultured Erythrobacter sp.]|uniref:hypothetical protein n=1 Tax=uncultured Erythrobacter sp. TaxID=263913 RepID=UPI00261EDB07|nr:hypothetical protein [uncultured Erythrobacter sp.]